MRNKLFKPMPATEMQWGHINRGIAQLLSGLGKDASRFFHLIEGRHGHALRRLVQASKHAFMELSDSERFAIQEFGEDNVLTRGRIIHDFDVDDESPRYFTIHDGPPETMFPLVPIPQKFLTSDLWNRFKEYRPFLVYVPAMPPTSILGLAFRIDPQYQRFHHTLKHEPAHWVMAFRDLHPVCGAMISFTNWTVQRRHTDQPLHIPSANELAMITSYKEIFSELSGILHVRIGDQTARLETFLSLNSDAQTARTVAFKKDSYPEDGSKGWISIHTLTKQEISDPNRAVQVVIR